MPYVNIKITREGATAEQKKTADRRSDPTFSRYSGEKSSDYRRRD